MTIEEIQKEGVHGEVVPDVVEIQKDTEEVHQEIGGGGEADTGDHHHHHPIRLTQVAAVDHTHQAHDLLLRVVADLIKDNYQINMQNTSRIQNIPKTLLKNFFISGLSQPTLIGNSSIQQPQIDSLKNNPGMILSPEILFSLYEQKSSVQAYLPVSPQSIKVQFVFPSKVQLLYQPERPKFFTFMSTGADGFNDFFHIMVVYEEVNFADLQYDFQSLQDIIAKEKKKARGGTETSTGRATGVGNEVVSTLESQQKEQCKKRMEKRKKATQMLYIDDVHQNMKSNSNKCKDKKRQIRRCDTQNLMLQVCQYREEKEGDDKLRKSFIPSYSQIQSSSVEDTNKKVYQSPTFGGGGVTADASKVVESMNEDDSVDGKLFETENVTKDIIDLYNEKRYVPVAFCLQTETEYHDMFREILISLFESVRHPDQVHTSDSKNRDLAFAEFITHIAYLKTIPSPPFSTIFKVQFLDRVFTIKENGYDEIPHKNEMPIKVLFDCLDVKTILYCWKALLFDKTLILISSQYSLQFYIAEALKQLLYPLTWQNSYIQPGNPDLIGLADGAIRVIYGSHPNDASYEDFEEMARSNPDIAICDIDASFTNNIELPTIFQEPVNCRILSIFKNSRVQQYDLAYENKQEQEAFTEEVYQTIRETFFNILKPYLQNIERYISQNDENANFYQYFETEEYLEQFVDIPEQYEFAENLVKCSQFVHFCDDSWAEEQNNFFMLREIMRSRQMLDSSLHSKTCLLKQKKFITPDEECDLCQRVKEAKTVSYRSKMVQFYFRIPQEDRTLLFDKIVFQVSESMGREIDCEDQQRSTLLKNSTNDFKNTINQIKDLYKPLLETQRAMNGVPEVSPMNGKSAISPPQKPFKRMQSDLEEFKLSRDGGSSPSMKQPRIQKVNSKIDLNFNIEMKPSQLRMPADMMISLNSVPQNMSILENERDRLRNCEFKAVKLMYGKSGFINFCTKIFGAISSKDRSNLHYYFLLRPQLDPIKNHRKQSNNSHELGLPRTQSVLSNESQFMNINSYFGNKDWMSVDIGPNEDLSSNFQFILFQTKSFEAFESCDDAESLIYHALLRFQDKDFQYFPMFKFMRIWNRLTLSQKRMQFEKLGQNLAFYPQRKLICEDFITEKTFQQQYCSVQGKFLKEDDGFEFKVDYDALSTEASTLPSPTKQNSSSNYDSNRVSRMTLQAPLTTRNSHKNIFSKFFSSTSDPCKKMKQQHSKQIEQVRDRVKNRMSKAGTTTELLNLKQQSVIQEEDLVLVHACSLGAQINDYSRAGSGKSPQFSQSIISQNYDMGGAWRQSVDKNMKQLTDPDIFSRSLLKTIFQYWKTNKKHMNKVGVFANCEIPRLKEELKKINETFSILKNKYPDFRKDDQRKMVFFLNVRNAMVLFQFANLMLERRDLNKKLICLNSWQQLLQDCKIYIAGMKITGLQIENSILRANLSKPKLSKFITGSTVFQDPNFLVTQPHPLLAFGLFLPLKSWPMFAVYKKETLDMQLTMVASEYLIPRVSFSPESYFISFPRIIEFYRGDFGTSSLTQLIDFLIKKVFVNDFNLQEKGAQLLHLIKQEGRENYAIEFKQFNWHFAPSKIPGQQQEEGGK